MSNGEEVGVGGENTILIFGGLIFFGIIVFLIVRMLLKKNHVNYWENMKERLINDAIINSNMIFTSRSIFDLISFTFPSSFP